MLKDKDVKEKLEFCQMYFVKSLRRRAFLSVRSIYVCNIFYEKFYNFISPAGPFSCNCPTLCGKSPKYDDIFYPGILSKSVLLTFLNKAMKALGYFDYLI